MKKGIFYNDATRAFGKWEKNFDELFTFLKAHNIDGFQFYDKWIYNEGEDELLCAMKKHGMKTYIIHILPRLMAKDDEIFAAAVKESVEKIELLKKLDCKRLMIVPFPKSDVEGEEDLGRATERMIEGLKLILPEAKKEGIELYIENFSTKLLPYGTSDGVEKILDAVPEVKYVFDTGNFFCIDEDPHAEYERLKDRIAFVHVKNFEFREIGLLLDNGRRVKSPAFDKGPMDLPALFEKMAKDGLFDVPYVIELNDTLDLDAIALDEKIMRKYLG